MSDDKPIIVVKKKGGHGGHHGGAWKVAYADFVTAMMAFFMVMWLVNSAEAPTKQNIASYFRKPGLFREGSGTPVQIGEAGILQDAYVPPHPYEMNTSKGQTESEDDKQSGTDAEEADKVVSFEGVEGAAGLVEVPDIGSGYHLENPEDLEELRKIERAAMEAAAAEIREQFELSPELKELLGDLEVKVEADGLNIEIMDTKKTSMFTRGSSSIQTEAQAAFAKLAGILGKLPNNIDIIGHTDSMPFSSRKGGYSNWELSADRANAARRVLEQEGIDPTRITSVIGRADKEPKLEDDPLNASNRRITLKMRFDINHAIDLAKDPDALDDLEQYRKVKPEPLPDPVIEQAEEIPAEPAEDEPVHSFTPREIISGAKKRREGISLPDAEPSEANPAPAETTGQKETVIFGDNPVLGPPDPFSGY